ncbi:MAG: hypothetical protein K6E71_10115 [Lachnospiraceae bacterium]|jgi:hypothetical protein|nr:hypothetical protein [Lachnospiraceae bacterium]MCR5377088.1 hypothetical protein [Lachnospiraceae bacterium]
MKDKLRAMLTRNVAMKLVSIVLALLVWVTIINLSDPTVTKTITGIPIEWRNEDLVKSDTTAYVTEASKEVTIRIEGVRSKIADLSASDFVAYIDFSEMSNVYAVPVHVEAKNAEVAKNTDILKQSMMMMSGKLEETTTKQLNIIVNTKNADERFYARVSYQSQYQANLFGSKSLVDSVAKLVADVDLQGATQDVSKQNVPFVAYDWDNNVVDLKDIGIPENMSKIEVQFELLPIQEKKIEVDVSAVPIMRGQAIRSVEHTTSIRLAGRREVLNAVGDTIKVNYINKGREELIATLEDNDVDIKKFLPNEGRDLYLVDGKQTISVKIVVDKLDQKNLTVKTTDIRIQGLTKSLAAAFDEETVAVTVWDFKEKLTEYVETNLGLYVDLSEVVEEGTVTVELRSTSETVDKSLSEEPVKVTLTVTKAQEDDT